MSCCTPQDRPEAEETPTATSVDGDTEMQDTLTQKCQDMFPQGMPDCCAQAFERTRTDASATASGSAV